MDIPLHYRWAQERGSMLLGTHLHKQQMTMTMMMLLMMVLMMTRLSAGSLGSPEDDDEAQRTGRQSMAT